MKKKLPHLVMGISLSFACLTQSLAQDTQIKFFGQPEFGYKSERSKLTPIDWITGLPNENEVKHSNTNFNTGKLVLFVTSQLTERISVLNENSMSTEIGRASCRERG